MQRHKRRTHTTILSIVFLFLSVLYATKINATQRKNIPEFYEMLYATGTQKPQKDTYAKEKQKGNLQGPIYLAGKETPWHLRTYKPAISKKHYITLYTSTGTTLNPYVNPYNYTEAYTYNDECNHNDLKDIKSLVMKYGLGYKPEKPSRLIGKEVHINFKKIRYETGSKELITHVQHPLDYKIAKKRNRHKPDVLAMGYVRDIAKKHNIQIPQELYNLIKVFYVLRYIRKHEKQDTLLLSLCKKHNTYSEFLKKQVTSIIASRKKSLPRSDFYSYMSGLRR